MTVSFEFDLDDAVDVAMRSIRSDRPLRKKFLWKYAQMGLLFAVVVTLALSEDQWVRFIAAIGAFAAGGALAFALDTRRLRKVLRSEIERVSIHPRPWVCTVTADERGLITTQPNGSEISPWQRVTDVRERKRDVEIHVDKRLVVVIRNRAFASRSDQRIFLETVRRGIQAGVEAKRRV